MTMMDEEFHALDDAFASFRDGSGSLPGPLGPAAARATVRRRRQLRAGITGGLTALLIAAPVAAYAAGVIGTNGPPTGESATPPPPPTPSATASPTPSPTPSTQSPSPQVSEPPPDGRIDQATLMAARPSLPAWPYHGAAECPAGEHQLLNLPVNQGDISVRQLVYVDVDEDGAEETAALLHCQVAQSGEWQVVVFDRNADGDIETVGSVVASSLSGQDEGLPEHLKEIRAAGNSVEVLAGDIVPCCGLNPDITQYQWRAYSLVGDVFRQTGGPTGYGVNPLFTDLQVKTVTVQGTTTGDTFDGTLRITFRNNGPSSAHTWVMFALPKPATLKTLPMGCVRNDYALKGEREEGSAAYVCGMGPVVAGADVDMGTFDVTGPAASFPAGAEKAVTVQIRATVPGIAEWESFRAIPDLKDVDNSKTVTFTIT
jgi:hypothetical protein